MARPVDPHAKIELLRAAEQVFVEHGLEKARVEEITARAGRSKGSFYLHFESKEEAFQQIVESTLLRLVSFLDCMTPRADAHVAPTLEEQLAAAIEREIELFEFLWQNRGVMRLMLQGGGGAQFGYLIDEFAERARERCKEMLRDGVARGLHRPDLDIEVASLFISGAYDRLARQLVRLDKKPDLRAWIVGVQRVLLAGIAGPELRALFDRPVSEAHARPRRASGTFDSAPVSTASPESRVTPKTRARTRTAVR